RGYKGLTTCVERITHWVIRPTRRLFANALSALTKSEYCAIFAQYSGLTNQKSSERSKIARPAAGFNGLKIKP
ncbi:MAG: hypothetical protein KKG09_10755, partial [Verrucomicrobia bacterium]|nr:hypothetical protein [Verrucomicrobiota bacterium]MBU4290503.1 hypothetical protein [Verrucomicrobiota bacterium]MBU4498472.1 hypothetical protein [Verrucomicrobiota bacterium]